MLDQYFCKVCCWFVADMGIAALFQCAVFKNVADPLDTMAGVTPLISCCYSDWNCGGLVPIPLSLFVSTHSSIEGKHQQRQQELTAAQHARDLSVYNLYHSDHRHFRDLSANGIYSE